MLAKGFHGGLRLPDHKDDSAAGSIRRCPLPDVLRVPLLQHAGAAAVACVAVGDTVARGSRIGIAEAGSGADVHAPWAGRIVAIEARPLPDRPDRVVDHVVIAVDAASSAELRLPPLDPWQATADDLRARVAACGLVGLGGAGFPTADKLAAERSLLVLNGAECEPWIACDDALLRASAGDVVRGGRVLARATGAPRILLAVEDRMGAAIAACRDAIAAHADGDVELAVVPTIYPQGGERQLIETLIGREVPRHGLPRDIGILVHNVATAHAAWRAVVHGEALVERVVTVAGRGVARPGNFLVPAGTTVAHLVAAAGGYTDDARRLLLGGPMMGTALPDDSAVLAKTHACVLVLGAADGAAVQSERPCIRCGDCADVCPPRLLPQQLLLHARGGQLDRALDQGLFDCIECGCCDLACPSHIPLVSIFRAAKTAQAMRTADAQRADAARARFDARQQRLDRDAEARAQRARQQQADATSSDAVEAALARARAKRGAPPEAGP